MRIGIFDSGVGGLTAVRELECLAPKADYIYFGDTARVPYGTRSAAVINKYAVQDCRFLLSRDVGAVLAACGTVSSNSLEILNQTFSTAIIGVVEPAVKKAVQIASESNGKIVVLGTKATIQSGSFEKAIKNIAPQLNIISQACPLFVPLAENGFTAKDCKIAKLTAMEYLNKIIPEKPSAVILGCTHYPLLWDIIADLLPDSVLVNTSKEAVSDLLASTNMLKISQNETKQFFTSDEPEMFRESAYAILGRDIGDLIKKVEIEIY